MVYHTYMVYVSDGRAALKAGKNSGLQNMAVNEMFQHKVHRVTKVS